MPFSAQEVRRDLVYRFGVKEILGINIILYIFAYSSKPDYNFKRPNALTP